LNGREWLARQLDAAGAIDYRRVDNCFTWLGDPDLAQRLMDEQLATDWKQALDQVASWINPVHDEIFEPWPQSYYWCTYQSEWATDLAFARPADLASVYPRLVARATLDFHSPDVMRLLGRKCHGRYEGELTTRFKDRAEGSESKLNSISDGLRILGLAFELTGEGGRDRAQVREHQAHHGADWPVLVAGLSDKAKASEAFPVLDKIRSYPTVVFMDSDRKVRGVWTGFSGPATGAAHESLVRAWDERIDAILGGTGVVEGKEEGGP